MTSLAITQWLQTLVSEDREAVFVIDDFLYDRSRSKKVELLARVYDHVAHAYRRGFRLLTLGWSDGSTFLPVAFSLLSPEQPKIDCGPPMPASTSEPLDTGAGRKAGKNRPMWYCNYFRRRRRRASRPAMCCSIAGLPFPDCYDKSWRNGTCTSLLWSKL